MPSTSVSESAAVAQAGFIGVTADGRDLARSDVRAQFSWYLLVGGLSFMADLIVFAGLLAVGVGVMAALVLGFVVGTLSNYVLSRTLAFTGGRFRRTGEVLRLVAVALLGLLLTAVLIALLMRLGAPALVAKIVATPIALGWNYFGRRRFVFHAEMPIGIWRLSSHLADHARSAVPGLGRRRDE